MKNVNKLFAAALVCLLALIAYEHSRVSAVQTGGAIGATTTVDDSTLKQTPKAHAASHKGGGSDAIDVATTSVSGLHAAADKTAWDQFFTDGPRSAQVEFDDFIFGGNSADGAPTITTAVPFSKLQWRPSIANSATLKVVTTQQDASHGGILQFETITNTASSVGIGRFPTTSTPSFKIGSGQALYYETDFRIEDLSDGTNTYVWEFGWAQAMGVAITDGVFMAYSSASPSSGNFVLRTCASSSCTTGTGGSTATAAADTWYRAGLSWDGTTACGYINGTSVGCTTSTIPTAGLTPIIHMNRSAGTASRLIYLDWAFFRDVRATPRG